MFTRIFTPKETINFLKYSKLAFCISLILFTASVIVWCKKGDDKYGIDYKGGYEIIVSFEDNNVKSQDIRDAIAKIGFEEAVVQAFDNSNEFVLKLEDKAQGKDQGKDKESVETVKKLLRDSFNENIFKGSTENNKFEILKVDYVGPSAGEELRTQALIAISISVIGILIYISVRYEFAFALGAIVALFHDICIGLGIYLMLGQTISVTTLAAALTLLGYSVNDTIVCFDRMREKLIASKNYVLENIINEALTEMLSRTIITSILTLFTAIALLVIGGNGLKDLSLFLVIGIVIGCYSSIFIASPVALWYADRKK